MMKIYRRDLNKSRLILDGERVRNGFEWKMLKYCRPKGLLPVVESSENGRRCIQYDITGHISVDAFLETEKPDLSFLKRLLLSLKAESYELQRYLLDPNDLLLDPETMFLDHRNREFYFCLLPVDGNDVTVHFREFMEYLLQKIDHKDEAMVKTGYAVYQRCTEEGYSLSELLAEFPEEEMTPLSAEPEEIPQEFPVERVIRYPEENRRKKPRHRFFMGAEKKEPEADRPAPEILMSAAPPPELEATTFLNPEDDSCRGELKYLGHGSERDFLVKDTPFYIGTKEGIAGHMDSQAVSRQHAKITEKEGTYYLEDLNSTNGTYLNEEIVNYRAPVQLHARDHILFADEEYLFF